MGEEVQVAGSRHVDEVVVGYCRPIIDRTIVTNDGEAEPILESLGVATGVSFVDDNVIREVTARLSDAAGSSPQLASPGGPVSNAIFAFANALGPYPRVLRPIWSGPYPSAAANEEHDPLPHLRSVGIRTVPQPASGGHLPQSLCVVARDSGDTVAILVGDREKMTIDRTLPRGHVALTMISDLPAVHSSGAAGGYALMTADLAELDADMHKALDDIAATGRIRFLFGSYVELQRLGFVRNERIIDERVWGAEVVATDGDRPVRVWSPGVAVPQSLGVQALVATGGGFLGAGDAYSGTFLACRLAGFAPADAHHSAAVAARHASYHLRARSTSDTNLTELFGSHIERASDAPDWDLFSTVRMSAGTTVVSCLNTGVDELAARIAARWGLAYFGIMPRGRRRDEDSDPPEADIVELGSESYRYCTWANVYVSDGTVLIDVVGGEGSAETRHAAGVLNRPLLELDLTKAASATFAAAREWAMTHAVRVVNVAGNRRRLLDNASLRAADIHVDAALRGIASQFQVGIPSPDRAVLVDPQQLVIGIPRLDEVSSAVRNALESLASVSGEKVETTGLVWNLGQTTIVRAKSRDLVRAVGRGELSAAFVGLDMVLDEPSSHVDVVAQLGLFNAAVVVVGPQIPRRETGELGAQYLALAAESSFAATHATVPIAGAGEGWVAAGILDAVVDTWRTGKTAREHGLQRREELARCPLSLIVPAGERVPHIAVAVLSQLAQPADTE